MKTCPVCQNRNLDDTQICESCGNPLGLNAGFEETRPGSADIEALAAGDLIADRYEVVRELGRGGMGVVYLVRDTELRHREVALKMIHSELIKHSEARQRFVDEVIICQELTHPSIVKVFHLDRIEEHQFFTMEYVAGRSLRELIDDRKSSKTPFSLPEAIAIINPLLEALSYAHHKTIHRDVKPENIIVRGQLPDVEIKVLDFGIAKTLSPSHYSMGQVVGTPYYIAPEQRRGVEIDHRADLYPVGMILYEMLTGELAEGSWQPPGEIIKSLPEEVDRIVETALAPKAEDRCQSAGEIQAALKDALTAYEARLVELREEEENRRTLARIENLLEDGQKAFERCRWKQAGGIFKQVLELDSGNKQAKALMEKAADNLAQLDKLETDARKAETSGDIEKAFSLLGEIAGLCEDQQAVEDRIRRLETQLEKQRQDELERRQKAEAERPRREQEQQEAKRRIQVQEERHRQEQEHFEKEKLKKEQEQRESEQRQQAEEEKRREERERLEAKQRQKEEEHRIAEKATRSRRKARIGVIAVAVVLVVTGILYFTNKGKMSLNPTVSNPLPEVPKQPAAGSIIEGPLPGMKFAYIPPGTFMMGSPSNEKGRSLEEEQHFVKLTKGFYMQTTEVTQGQWKAVMGLNPSWFRKCGADCPVEQVSWDNAQEFIRKLNRKEGTDKYRLSTEAEWEYAARAGSTTAFANGGINETRCGNDPNLHEMGWYCGNSMNRTHPAAQKKANAWGLYDMHGNVWEWCLDWYGEYPTGSVNDPQGPSSDSHRVIRGGSWFGEHVDYGASGCRSATRGSAIPGARVSIIGFRLARDK